MGSKEVVMSGAIRMGSMVMGSRLMVVGSVSVLWLWCGWWLVSVVKGCGGVKEGVDDRGKVRKEG